VRLGDCLLSEIEMLKAHQRAQEWREMAETYCADGGLLLADCTCPEHEETD
jgi:hypothetical protein